MRRQTKYTSISASVKKTVYLRDNGRCVLCGRPGDPWCHVVSRGHGGLGKEENVVTLCPKCHREYDQGPNRKAFYVRIVAYLKGFYPDWNREDMIYKKGVDR